MGDIEGLTKKEIKDLILSQLDELGIDHAAIIIDVKKGPSVILKGAVYSDNLKGRIKQAILDRIGVDDVVDELIVIRDGHDGPELEGLEDDGLYRENEDVIGTEDVSQAIEDGIPYIPPTRPSHQGSAETIRWKKKKEKAR